MYGTSLTISYCDMCYQSLQAYQVITFKLKIHIVSLILNIAHFALKNILSLKLEKIHIPKNMIPCKKTKISKPSYLVKYINISNLIQ